MRSELLKNISKCTKTLKIVIFHGISWKLLILWKAVYLAARPFSALCRTCAWCDVFVVSIGLVRMVFHLSTPCCNSYCLQNCHIAQSIQGDHLPEKRENVGVYQLSGSCRGDLPKVRTVNEKSCHSHTESSEENGPCAYIRQVAF